MQRSPRPGTELVHMRSEPRITRMRTIPFSMPIAIITLDKPLSTDEDRYGLSEAQQIDVP